MNIKKIFQLITFFYIFTINTKIFYRNKTNFSDKIKRILNFRIIFFVILFIFFDTNKAAIEISIAENLLL